VDEGRIGEITVPEGTENVKVNAVIAVLLTEGETAPVKAAAAPPAAAPAKAEPVPAAVVVAPAPVAVPLKPAAPASAGEGARTFASPLARRLAKEAGIDVAAIAGTGPHGRVVKSDVEAAKAGKAPLKAPAKAPTAGQGTLPAAPSREAIMALYDAGSFDIVPNDGMRKVVAQRLTESKQTVPHFYLTLDCRIDALNSAREEINAAAPKKDGKPVYKLSVNDFIMKAWAQALVQVPLANATWAGDAILYHKHADVAVAVAVPGGLFTPVVKACEQKSLRQISDEVRDLATRARNKKLAPHEYQGGSSSVSNLGMYGIKSFAAVINPPHGTILAVGAGEERVYADRGAIKTGHFMTVTLSCDHRAVDGALGAELLAAFKALIENPVMMLV
jgi:pyruvate dehydrogenase E2 component (dihydrolipoamide acetyltransferase)